MQSHSKILLLLAITGLAQGSGLYARQENLAATTITVTLASGKPMAPAGAFNSTPLMTAGIVGGGTQQGGSPTGSSSRGNGIVSEQALKTAGIIANARPTGAGAMGVPQPPAVMNPKPVNSSTLAVAGIVQATPAAGTQATSATSGPGAVNSATLMTAGILASSQPGSEATVGIPQPSAASGKPAVDSATLGTAGIVGGASKTTAAGAAGGTGQITVPLNASSTQGVKSAGISRKTFDAGGIFVLATSLWLLL